MTREEQIRQLLVQWEERRLHGKEQTPEELCPRDPALREELRIRIAKRKQYASLIQPKTQPPQNQLPDVSDVNASVNRTQQERLAKLDPPKNAGEIGRLGSFRLLRIIGAGGMGVVYEGEDPRLKRRVALKMMNPQQAANGVARQRFLREAQAIAAIEHDHIVSIYHVGEDRGIPFIVMPLLTGMSLADRIQKGKTFSVPQILRIGREAAQGLSAAHDKGLIHRDIKPSNLWVSPEHGGRVKILDFGLVCSDAGNSEKNNLTGSGYILGTPAYMAPEQAEGQSVDHRCDLFSLGSVLYELCTGKQPFQGDSLAQLVIQLCTHDPPPPHRVRSDMPESVSGLVMKLLAKAPAGRFQSAHEVVEAIKGIEAQAPANRVPNAPLSKSTLPSPKKASVSRTRPPVGTSARYSRRRLLGGLGLGATAAMILFLFYTVFFSGGWERRKPPDPGESYLDRLDSKKIPEYERKILGKGDPQKAPKEVVAVLGSSRLRHWEHVDCVAFSPNGRHVASTGRDGKLTIWNVSSGEEVRTVGIGRGHLGRDLAYSPDGRLLATSNPTQLFKGETGEPFRHLHDEGLCVGFSPKGDLLATGSRNSVFVWNVADLKKMHVLEGLEREATSLAFNADGSHLVVASADRTLCIWQVSDEKLILRIPVGYFVRKVGWLDGGRIAGLTNGKSPGDPERLKVWASASGAELYSNKMGGAIDFSISRDGSCLAVTHGFSVTLLSTTNYETLKRIDGHKSLISTVSFGPDGKRIVSGGFDGAVRVWDRSTGKAVIGPDSHPGGVGCVAVAPEGSTVFSTGLSAGFRRGVFGSLANWDMTGGTPKRHRQIEASPFSSGALAMSHDGKLLAWSARRGNSNPIEVYDVQTGRLLRSCLGFPQDIQNLCFSPDGKRLAALGDRTFMLWNVETGQQLDRRDVNGYGGLKFSPDGKRLISLKHVGGEEVQVTDLISGKVFFSHKPAIHHLASVLFTADGKHLFFTSGQAPVTKCDFPSGKAVFQVSGHQNGTWISLSPNGLFLAAAGRSGVVRLYSADKGRLLRSIRLGSDGQSMRPFFTPDGRHLAVANANGTVYIVRLE